MGVILIYGDSAEYMDIVEDNENIYALGGLVVDEEKQLVTLDGRNVKLTVTEYKILQMLMQNMGKTCTAAEIYETVWKLKAIDIENTIAVHIRHIREKIEYNPKEPQYLRVVWGSGYVMG